MIAVWIIAVLVYLALGAVVESGFRPARRPRPRPQLEQVRDRQLDITEAHRRSR